MRYPLLTWEITYSVAVAWKVDITRTVGGTITVSGTIPASTYWGQDTAVVQGSDTPHGALCTAIDAALSTAGFASATVTGTWDDVASPWPRVSIEIGGVANALSWQLTITGGTAARRLGYLSTTTTSVSMVVSTTCNQDGLWSPMVPWSDVDYRSGYNASQTINPFSPAIATVVELGANDQRLLQWRHVPARYVEERWAASAAFAGASGNSVLDTLNTVQGLVDVAITGATMRAHYETATFYETVRLAWSADLRTSDLAEVSQPSGRRMTITVPVLVAQ